MTQWGILFFVASGIYILGAVVFAVFISAKPEDWGKANTETAIPTIVQRDRSDDN